jgi:hypothetical protein
VPSCRHVVIDAGVRPGGAWQTMAQDTLSLSPASWMSLPETPEPAARQVRKTPSWRPRGWANFSL